MQFVTKKHEIVFFCMHLFLHANFILVYSFPAVCSISDGQWCNKKKHVLMLQRLSAVWNEHFWFTFHFFCCIRCSLCSTTIENSSNKTCNKKILSDSESQLFSIMILPHINRAHVGCVFMLFSLLYLTARSLGDLYLYVVYFFSLMNGVENIKWFQTSYRTLVAHWTKRCVQ